jgi:hypothetical protein
MKQEQKPVEKYDFKKYVMVKHDFKKHLVMKNPETVAKMLHTRKKNKDMKQTIVDFFDPYNVSHLKAYRHLEKTGFWPKGFIPDEIIGLAMAWQVGLVAKLARAWLQAAEAGHIIDVHI